jgi:hypothetical protein
MGTVPQAQVSTRGWRATAGRRPALGHRPVGGDLWSSGFQRLVAAGRLGPDHWSPVVRRPEVAVLQSAAQGRPATSGRRLRLWGSFHFS